MSYSRHDEVQTNHDVTKINERPFTSSLLIFESGMFGYVFSQSHGLRNGTRLHFLRCTIIGGKHRGKVHLLPRIPLQSSDNDAQCPFSFKRIQFPVRLAYAMTTNKSQGLTLVLTSSGRRFSATENYQRVSEWTKVLIKKILFSKKVLSTRKRGCFYRLNT